MAEYCDIDSSLVRLGFLLLVLGAGTGILAYIIAWIVVPERP
ncbi:MAG: PspC domain-containing protein [bacterium]